MSLEDRTQLANYQSWLAQFLTEVDKHETMELEELHDSL